jgi:hypothetical protein
MSIPSQRGTETSNLVNVIDVIQLGRKTGVLTVEREANGHLELGEITFTNGQVTRARSNHYLSTEGQAAFRWLRTWEACRFLFEATQATGRTTGPLPTTTRPLPAAPSSAVDVHNSETQPHRVPTNVRAQGGGQEEDNFSAVPRRIIYVEKALHIIENAQLSRTHRQLFLLIDGQRNVAELLRLLGRKQDEGLKLLRDLAYIGVIR